MKFKSIIKKIRIILRVNYKIFKCRCKCSINKIKKNISNSNLCKE